MSQGTFVEKSFIVQQAIRDDNSILSLSRNAMRHLELSDGDFAHIKSQSWATIMNVLSGYGIEDDSACINEVARANLEVSNGDEVSISPCLDLKQIERISILPFADSLTDLTDDIFDAFLCPYFRAVGRPARKGDCFKVSNIQRLIEFKVVDMQPSDYGLVGDDTIIHCTGKPIERETKENCGFHVDYLDIGGYTTQIAQIKALLEHQSTYSEIFRSMNIKPPRGVLMFGPAGTGKTLTAYAVAKEAGSKGIFCYFVRGSEIVSGTTEESIRKLRRVFEDAESHSPALIFLDDVDVISSRTEGTILSQLVTLIDKIHSTKSVFIISSTNRPDQLDASLFRPGRIDNLIYFPLPDEESRVSILEARLRKTKVVPNVNLNMVARHTAGFSGADLSLIVQHAAKKAISDSLARDKNMKSHDPGPDPYLTPTCFQEALKSTRRSVSEDQVRRCQIFAKEMDRSGDDHPIHDLSSAAADSSNPQYSDQRQRYPVDVPSPSESLSLSNISASENILESTEPPKSSGRISNLFRSKKP